ncbi:hypothetical protein [Microcoleus sp.]|uniref:hypothetical protein n=1 Tax=Microcoleus sp. TaxID=44472 RepID=UPI00403E58C3
MSSPVVGADLFYFFLKHRAIVLGSAANRVCLTLVLILPSTLSIELSDADNPVNLPPDFSGPSSSAPIELAPVGDRVNLCYIF